MKFIDEGNKYLLIIDDRNISKMERLEFLRCFMTENDVCLFSYDNISAEDIISSGKAYRRKHNIPHDIMIIDEVEIRTSIEEKQKFVNDRKIFMNNEAGNPQVSLPKHREIRTTWFRCRNDAEMLNELRRNFCCIIIEPEKSYEEYSYKISECEIDEGLGMFVDINKSKFSFNQIFDRICSKFDGVEIGKEE